MLERNTGFRSVLTLPAVYRASQTVLYRSTAAAARVQAYFPNISAEGFRVLDIGSGPATFLATFSSYGNFDYVAIDPSERYIAMAHERFSGRGRFIVGTTRTVDPKPLGRFDLIVADGVLHHVSDEDAIDIAGFARDLLAPEGHFLTFDPVKIPRQRLVPRLLHRMDRGARIRTAHEYADLLAVSFGHSRVRGAVVSDRLRVPYDHFESVSG